MNRRTFLCKTLYACGSLYLGQNLYQIPNVFARASENPSKNFIIKETNLKFTQALQNRYKTNLIVIHHVGGTDLDVSSEEIHKWHLANGWAGIGYHYVIRKDGTIERGRPRDAIGAHSYNYNKTSIGINLVGNFEIATPTSQQLESAGCLCAELCRIYGFLPNKTTIRGHKDLNHDTLCPGKNLYSQLKIIRRKAFIYV
ncbi:peptidoglycan recognition protein family protein [Anaerosinus massiliensis]|uniref:peptidoglycan recognition protein family protein n=1 Tax=Massilibacillus massiliensis TaxID=1806837 RepID=UPI000A4D51F1|nr:peptidoglycan recognition family protein [Massilibacillus massiliensis]